MGRDAGVGLMISPASGEAVAFQIDTAHSGNQPVTTLATSLAQKWSIDLQGLVSYPLIAGGRVFVTVGNVQGDGGQLVALNLDSGTKAWEPVEVGGGGNWVNAAYDGGRLYVINRNGQLSAFAAETGTGGGTATPHPPAWGAKTR